MIRHKSNESEILKEFNVIILAQRLNIKSPTYSKLDALAEFLVTLRFLNIYKDMLDISNLGYPVWKVTADVLLRRHSIPRSSDAQQN